MARRVPNRQVGRFCFPGEASLFVTIPNQSLGSVDRNPKEERHHE